MSERKNPWRVAFLGAGTIVQLAHIPSFQRLPGVETVALCDVNKERADAVANAVGIPHVYTDYEAMLAEIQPDITVVATPNIFHKSMTIAALEAGSHVLCEKPLAITYDDAAEMMAAAAEKGLTLNVGTHYRFSMPMQTAKAHVNGGFFGDIFAGRTVWQRRSDIPGYGSWFTNMDLAGGGSLLDIGVHALDRALYLMNYPQPLTVSGVSFSKFGSRGMGLGSWGVEISAVDSAARFDVDDFAWALIRFKNGSALQFQVAWANHLPEQFFTELYGTEGAARMGNKEGIELYTMLNGQEADIQTPIPDDPYGSYSRLIKNFVNYLNGDPSATIVLPEEALIAVRIVEGIMRSAASGQEVLL